MAKVGPKMKILIAMGISATSTGRGDFWKELRDELNVYLEEEEESNIPEINSSDFKLSPEGIQAAKKVLDDPYATPNRRNEAANFLIMAHDKGMYK